MYSTEGGRPGVLPGRLGQAEMSAPPGVRGGGGGGSSGGGVGGVGGGALEAPGSPSLVVAASLAVTLALLAAFLL